MGWGIPQVRARVKDRSVWFGHRVKNERVYWTAILDFFSKFRKLGKIVTKNVVFKECFRSFFLLEFGKRNGCDGTLYGVCVYTISCKFLEEWSSFDILNVKNGHFARNFLTFLYFSDFHFSPSWISQICSRVIFLIPDEAPRLKTCITPPKPEIISKTFPWLHDLT